MRRVHLHAPWSADRPRRLRAIYREAHRNGHRARRYPAPNKGHDWLTIVIRGSWPSGEMRKHYLPLNYLRFFED